MKEKKEWTIRIMRRTSQNGMLVAAYLHVCSSTDGLVRGSIDMRGSETSNLLALLSMCSGVSVVDCSHPATRQPDGTARL